MRPCRCSAVSHQLFAINERRIESGIVLAILSDSATDLTAEEDFGLIVRANCPASFRGRPLELVHWPIIG